MNVIKRRKKNQQIYSFTISILIYFSYFILPIVIWCTTSCLIIIISFTLGERPLFIYLSNHFLKVFVFITFNNYVLKGGNKKRWNLSLDRIGDVGLIVLASSVVDRWFYPLYAKTYKMCYYFFSANQETLRMKSKDWLVRVRIVCSSGATCPLVDSCINLIDPLPCQIELILYSPGSNP